MKSLHLLLTLLLVSLIQPACQFGFAAERIPVFVSIVPQKYFLQQIGKDLVDVQVMVPPGANPHIFEPKPRLMAALSNARAYFAIGVPFENAWLNKFAAANPSMKIVQTDQGIRKIPMVAHGHDHDQDKGTDGGVSRMKESGRKKDGQGANLSEKGELDPHIWLSPPLVKVQSRTILAALEEIDPANGGAYKTNYHQFMTEIDRLDDRLKKVFSGKKGMKFLVFHPSWGYFSQAYGLEQVSMEIEGKDPKPARLKEQIEDARRNGIEVIFVQPQFSAKSANLLAREIGGKVAYADPMAEDWKNNLLKAAEQFESAVK